LRAKHGGLEKPVTGWQARQADAGRASARTELEAKHAGGKPTKRLRLVARKLIERAEKGDVAAIREIFDRVDGRVSSAQVLEPEPVNILHELLQSIAKKTHILPSDDVDDPYRRHPQGDTITVIAGNGTGAIAPGEKGAGQVTSAIESAGVATPSAKTLPAGAPLAPRTNGHANGGGGAAERYGLTMPRMKSLLPDDPPLDEPEPTDFAPATPRKPSWTAAGAAEAALARGAPRRLKSLI